MQRVSPFSRTLLNVSLVVVMFIDGGVVSVRDQNLVIQRTVLAAKELE